MITREFNLYLHAGHSIPLVINVNQYDSGETWVFTLFNSDGTQYIPSSGDIVGIKSDNLGIINSGAVDGLGRVLIDETEQMTAAVGKAVFELVIDEGTHGTANFVVLVEPKPGDNADLSETDISMIEQAIEAASTIKPYGSPLVASTVAGMADHDKVYVYVGSETGYTSGHWYYYDGDSWEDGGVYNSVAVQTDTTLTLSGVAADAKKTGDEISDLKSQISQGGSFNNEVKSALDLFTASVKQLAQVVAYTVENGQAYYGYIADASDALHSAMYPPANLVSITAVYAQSGTVYDTDSLDNLKSDLIVTANWSNNTSTTITDYMLNGTLTEGTSAITVSYGGKTTTFSVTVTHYKGFAYGKVDKTNAITGSYITESGEIESATSASGYYDDYIDLGGLSSVLIHHIGSDSNFRISVFNTSKEFTRQIHVTGNRYYTFSLSPTTGERYIKLGWYSTSEPTFYIQNVAPTSLIMEIGSIDTNGENVEAANRIRSVGYIPANGVITVDDAPWEMWRGYEYFFRCYDESHNYVGTLVNTGGKLFSADISQVSLPTGTANVRIVMQIKSGSFSSGFAQDTHPFAIDNESYQISED